VFGDRPPRVLAVLGSADAERERCVDRRARGAREREDAAVVGRAVHSPTKSRYTWPSASVRRAPSPRTIVSGNGSWRMIVRVFRPAATPPAVRAAAATRDCARRSASQPRQAVSRCPSSSRHSPQELKMRRSERSVPQAAGTERRDGAQLTSRQTLTPVPTWPPQDGRSSGSGTWCGGRGSLSDHSANASPSRPTCSPAPPIATTMHGTPPAFRS
jgi:hypothetical protein